MFTSTPGDGRFRTTIVDVAEDFGDVVTQAQGASGLDWHPDGKRILGINRRRRGRWPKSCFWH